MQDSKPFWKSKRFYLTIFTAAAPYLPYVGPWVVANPEAFSGMLATVFGYVGIKSTQPIQFKISMPIGKKK